MPTVAQVSFLSPLLRPRMTGEAVWEVSHTIDYLLGDESDSGCPAADEEERHNHLGEDAAVHPQEERPFGVLSNVPRTNLQHRQSPNPSYPHTQRSLRSNHRNPTSQP